MAELERVMRSRFGSLLEGWRVCQNDQGSLFLYTVLLHLEAPGVAKVLMRCPNTFFFKTVDMLGMWWSSRVYSGHWGVRARSRRLTQLNPEKVKEKLTSF